MLLKTSPGYNPFYVEINDKVYFLNSIHAFDSIKGIIVAEQPRGWFGDGNNHTKTLEINCDCVLKRKINLTAKSAFIVKSANKTSMAEYALYIPVTALNLSQTVYEFYANRTTICRRAVSTINNSICFEEYRSIPESNVEISLRNNLTLFERYNNISSVMHNVKTVQGLLNDLQKDIDAVAKEREERSKHGADSYAYLFD